MGRRFTHWLIRKLADYLATRPGRNVRVGRERLRQILLAEGMTLQRTKTWKESPDPLKEQKLARIEWLLEHARQRTFAFDEFGPLTIKPVAGSAWAPRLQPLRLRANYTKPHGSRPLHASYSIATKDHVPKALPRRLRIPSRQAACPIYLDLSGAPGRGRTCDLRFRKPLLYPLSYGSGPRTNTRVRPGYRAPSD